LPHEAK